MTVPIPEIQPAISETDHHAIRHLFEAYAATLDIDLAYQDFATELETLPGNYAPPRGALFLARAGTAPVGCIALRPLAEPDICEMKRLYVTPAGRGTGLGKALVTTLLRAARQTGYRQIRLDTLPTMHRAIALYEASGFRPIPAYYDTPITGTVFFGLDL